MKNSFDPQNPRVRKAHQKHALNNSPMLALTLVVFIALLFGGIALLYFQNSISWTLIGFSSLPAMLIFWIKNDLVDIPIGKTDNFTDLISEDLLLLITKNSSPADLTQILPKTRSGAFIMARFNLPTPFFNEIANFLPATPEPIYETARHICETTNSEEITGAVLAVAIISSVPNYELLLNQFQLTITDLHQGIIWFNYLNGMVKNSKKPIHSGGIARDFAFGYTPTLQRFAINLSERYSGAHTKLQMADHTKIIGQIIETFTHGGRQNVALIGAYGSGRSTIVNALAETLMNADSKIPHSLKYRQIYSLDAPSLISAAKDSSELEYLMVNIFNEIYSAKNIILCLDNAHLFFEEGPGSVDIANLLTPILEAGHIRMILIMDDQKFLEISSKNSTLANSLNKIMVSPSNREETLKILMDQVPLLEYQKNVIYTYRALTEAYRLSEQYIHDVEMPGKAKLLLESATSYAEGNLVTALSVQTAVEKSYGVKVRVASDESDRNKLLNLEALIHERMIDQTEAVSAVANALRRAGAGVKHAGRPIGTFLFLGPTGVGKTELAKSLSEVYFNGEDNIIRLDMNEFVSAADVSRLIKDGAEDGLSLTAQVSKQPFSVILLDEIEKAHPSVLTTLLQVLDEGILRDEKNREISFRDSIIIATSNAGANEIREKIASGAKIDDFKEEFIENLISSNEFKPEFLNRFDEICLFKPLSKEDLVSVLDLIIASTNRTLEPQKISVVVDPAAKQILIDKGYDPKMGARPMRRIVQKTVENIVAAAILSGHATPGSTLHITPNEIKIS
ncbi:AAA family ATPase [Candidatus Nanosyncoccus alces]|uniref:ATP-dependent Clp protease ATP-binding subunit ClpC n=1 Tax=Candidatus Nanosyncoccus alces TaxID=2171997 RepID=A0ABY0FN54_9BACT|nr:ATP-dependent Clp protease ATP-binding subunit [Candidatus Nanosyncoccus alces]RYC74784.1 ATP-dependent Clp protease ATP-binding subunit ClpC [Candidatus Nanosyncoccus alces]